MESEKTTINDAGIGEPIQITEEIEKEYDLRKINVHSSVPFAVTAKGISIITENGSIDYNPITCGLLFAIKNANDQICSISFQDKNSRLDLSFYEAEHTFPYADNKHAVIRGVQQFFSAWQNKHEHYSICGTEEKLILFMCCDAPNHSVLKIELMKKSDYYNVAAWLILAFAHKRGYHDEDQAIIYDKYWPSKSTRHQDKTFDFANDEDISKRERLSPLAYSHLLLMHMFGYYDENDNPVFFANDCIINVEFGNGMLNFDFYGDSLKSRFRTMCEFTFSPFFLAAKGSGSQTASYNYIGNTECLNEDIASIQKAETIRAPYSGLNPIVLECKTLKIDESFIFTHVEANVFKTRLSDRIMEDGAVNILKALSYMAWESDPDENADVAEQSG